MKDIAIFMAVFVFGYLLTMGLLYVVLTIFPKREDHETKVIMKVSRNSRNGVKGAKGVEKSGKMKIA